jgi:hypothetical protein
VIKSGSKPKKPFERIILFVCVENAGRSQMAEGFFNQKYAPNAFEQSALELDLFLRSILWRFR